jgi:hypothetical protein
MTYFVEPLNPPTTTSTLPAPLGITRRRLAGLLVAATATGAAISLTVTTVIDDTAAPAHATTALSQYAIPAVPITAPLRQQVAAGAQPIVVADAYHGVGIIVCPDGSQPLRVADAYHGVGTTMCP